MVPTSQGGEQYIYRYLYAIFSTDLSPRLVALTGAITVVRNFCLNPYIDFHWSFYGIAITIVKGLLQLIYVLHFLVPVAGVRYVLLNKFFQKLMLPKPDQLPKGLYHCHVLDVVLES